MLTQVRSQDSSLFSKPKTSFFEYLFFKFFISRASLSFEITIFF